jgi:hypothetical protein
MCPSYDNESLVDSWIAQSETFEKAHAIERFARYAPELGWRAILSVLAFPEALEHLVPLSHALEILVSSYGDQFIDRIEHEAAISVPFKTCLARMNPSPTFPIPEHLWSRLSAAAGTCVGPMPPNLAALYAKIPNLADVATRDPHPMHPGEAPSLSDADLLSYASDYLVHERNFWAWEELDRLLREDGPETVWPLLLRLVEKGSDRVLCAAGAGILEDFLDMHGTEFIERIEERASRDPRFRFCLSHVWESTMPPEIWKRVVVARGTEPQRG